MYCKPITHALCGGLLLSLGACGGGGNSQDLSSAASSGGGSTASTGTVPLLVSDDSAEDWATIGVKVLSIALKPRMAATL
jgi:hypothetical protein